MCARAGPDGTQSTKVQSLRGAQMAPDCATLNQVARIAAFLAACALWSIGDQGANSSRALELLAHAHTPGGCKWIAIRLGHKLDLACTRDCIMLPPSFSLFLLALHKTVCVCLFVFVAAFVQSIQSA